MKSASEHKYEDITKGNYKQIPPATTKHSDTKETIDDSASQEKMKVLPLPKLIKLLKSLFYTTTLKRV